MESQGLFHILLVLVLEIYFRSGLETTDLIKLQQEEASWMKLMHFKMQAFWEKVSRID
jgi:hypothetical protein